MLQNIREHITGWVAGIFIVLIAVAFIFWGLQYYLEESARGSTAVAKVNGHEISEKEFNTLFQRLVRQQVEKNAGAPLDNQTRQAIKQYALQQIITQAALLNAAKKAGLNVSDNQIKQVIIADPEFQVDGQFSQQKFQELLYANASSAQQFFNQMRGMMIVNQISSGLQNSEFILPNELKRAFLMLQEKRDFGYFIMPIKNFISSIQVSDADIKKYYEQHLNNFKLPEKVQVSYLLLSPETISDSIKVTDQQVRQYYDANQSNYTSLKRWKISQIMVPVDKNASEKVVNQGKVLADDLEKKLKQGQTFSALMKEKGKTIQSANYWINKEQLSGPLLGILNSMQVNQISSPFRTQQGFVIIKIEAIQTPETKTFDEVKSDIRKRLVHQQAQRIFSQKSDQLTNLTYTNPNTLDIAAKALSLTVQKEPPITKKGAKLGVLSNPKVLAVVFSDDVLEGNNSQPIELKNGALIVLRVDQKIPSKEQDLASVSARIRQILAKQRAEREAGVKAYQIQTALAAGKNPQVLEKKFGLIWHEKSDINRDDKNINPMILNEVFNLSLQNQLKMPVGSVKLDNGDYAVVKLIKIIMPDYNEATENQKQNLKINLSNFYGQLAYRSFIHSATNNAKVKVYQK